MTRPLLLLIITIWSVEIYAQADNKTTNTSSSSSNSIGYRLYSTQNIWTFIKLNTKTGQIWQVQFSLKTDGRSIVPINSLSLVDREKESYDRFALYPTQNMYTFLLLDQLDGRTWQVQWSTNENNRGLLPIE